MKPEDIPQALIDEHRYIDVLDNWWYESTIECFVQEQKEQGLDINPKDIQFSGFCSQGDGASFSGNVVPCLSDWITRHSDPALYPFTMLMLAHDEVSWCFELERTNTHYSHEYTVRGHLDIEDDLDLIYDREHPMVEPHWETWIAQFHDEQDSLEEDIMDYCRARMRDLYKQLSDEHDYLTSDDYVRELLADNPHIIHLEDAA
ncbi:MAG: hypothetical protein VBE63_08400 [Lamprobacter sp.]|uniref:hypothetical protein n=1 Tax=Lamprobacter sp. TaxID=3100796 RepID=UPI002B25E155|nr:hypothetical protein [Lamprobacter sp.]MEA3639950.1 hypothetical protein [Lamprobacter sp.]